MTESSVSDREGREFTKGCEVTRVLEYWQSPQQGTVRQIYIDGEDCRIEVEWANEPGQPETVIAFSHRFWAGLSIGDFRTGDLRVVKWPSPQTNQPVRGGDDGE